MIKNKSFFFAYFLLQFTEKNNNLLEVFVLFKKLETCAGTLLAPI